MREDAERELVKQVSIYLAKWEQRYDAPLENKREELIYELEPCFYDSPMSFFVDKQKNEEKIVSILSSFFKRLAPATPTLSQELQSYYEARRAALCSLFREKYKSSQFPEWPHLWLNYITSTSPLPCPNDEKIRELAHAIQTRDYEPLRVQWTKKIAVENAIDCLIKPLFISKLPPAENFIKELLYQTTELWGDTPCEVFRRRMKLLLQRVLKPALARLETTLSAFGRNKARWTNQAPVAEMVESILKEKSMKEYRQLLQDVCDELDKQAKTLPDFYPPKQFTRIFTADELYKHMRCSFIKAMDFPQAFMRLLAEEQKNIGDYYSHILSRQYVTGSLSS